MLTNLIGALLLVITLIANPVKAQYEGELHFDVYKPDSFSSENVRMNMTFTKERIFVDANLSVDVIAGLQARGFLVRHDMEDFVIITDENEALKVAKKELESLSALVNRMRGTQVGETPPAVFPWEERVIQTGKKREILGYDTEEFVLKGDHEEEYASVWLTGDISVDWGLLLDAWYSIGAKQFKNEIPIEMLMNERSFPLFVEVYKGGEVVFRAETVYENSEDFDRGKTELPAGMTVIGITDLMMNIFRQN